MCHLPKDHLPGCMFPGAWNYNPSARQPTDCYYHVLGCTDSRALNFNKEADTTDNSCILPTVGCTVKDTEADNSYVGVDTNTPGYQSRWYGYPARAVGRVERPNYAAVTNYNSLANVLGGCIVAIEGCMDSSAVNYDKWATVNGNTWCIPSVSGCMMPSWQQASYNLYGSGQHPHFRDGGAANYNPAATVHDKALCLVERWGCMDSHAFNYDPYATYNAWCYPTIDGCFDNSATNYNCTAQGYDDTSTSPSAFVFYLAACNDHSPRPTTHKAGLCTYGTPTQTIEKASGSRMTMITLIICEGTIDDFDQTRLDAIKAEYCKEANLDPAYTTIKVTSGSVNVVFTTTDLSADAYNTATSNIQTKFNTVANINSKLGVSALSLPSIRAEKTVDSSDDAAIIGGAIGGAVGGLLLLCGCAFMYQRKNKKIEA